MIYIPFLNESVVVNTVIYSVMKFQDSFYSRLLLLSDRENQQFPPNELPEEYRRAAILIPLWPENDGSVKVAFTQRTEKLPSHKGQVSFPGGAMLPEDESQEMTALRETHEEMGIDPDKVTVMGRLDDAWSRYGFHIVPYVGWFESKPEFTPDYNEVAGILVANVETLMLPDSSCLHNYSVDGVTRQSQAFRWDEGYVWGLTADILLEMLLWINGEESNRRDARLKALRSFILK